MGLVHQFAIIPKDSDVSIVSSDMDSVSISDVIIQYIGDSLKWINTNWNGKKMQNGISYYGFSFIEDGEIIKLKKILKQWVELFRLSPDEFYLTGEFLPDEKRYENILVKRPGTGEIKAEYYNDILGKEALCDIAEDTHLSKKMIGGIKK